MTDDEDEILNRRIREMVEKMNRRADGRCARCEAERAVRGKALCASCLVRLDKQIREARES